MGDYHILMRFDIEADRNTVHDALTTQDGIASWWSTRTVVPTDGQLRVSFPDLPQPFEFTVTRDDLERVEWVTGGFPPPWAGTTIRWDMSNPAEDGGTGLLFAHRDLDPENPVIPIITPAWAQIILRLKTYAETGQARPFFDF